MHPRDAASAQPNNLSPTIRNLTCSLPRRLRGLLLISAILFPVCMLVLDGPRALLSEVEGAESIRAN